MEQSSRTSGEKRRQPGGGKDSVAQLVLLLLANAARFQRRRERRRKFSVYKCRRCEITGDGDILPARLFPGCVHCTGHSVTSFRGVRERGNKTAQDGGVTIERRDRCLRAR